jgi:hypothetical protein
MRCKITLLTEAVLSSKFSRGLGCFLLAWEAALRTMMWAAGHATALTTTENEIARIMARTQEQRQQDSDGAGRNETSVLGRG